MHDGFANLEDYGVIGNQETCALVGKDGSLDWLCIPYLDSPSVFAALLDPGRGGVFSLTPDLKFQSLQRYTPNTNVLVTDFSTAIGETSITDFMPPLEAGVEHRMLLRRIHGERLDSRLRLRFRPAFDYGRRRPDFVREGNDSVAALGDGLRLRLNGGDFTPGKGEMGGLLKLKEGETIWIVLTWGDANPPSTAECERLLKVTEEFWRGWSESHRRSGSVMSELYDNVATRSGLALKLLLNPKTGGIAAAASLALPESIGGIRNWDYRFAWIRDASFTAQALFHLGYPRESAAYRKWVLDIVGQVQDLSEIRPLYPLHESAKIEEGEIAALSGYRLSAPVRVGNLASRQTQLDIYGELVNTVFETVRHGEEVAHEVWETVRRICDFVCDNWDSKDRGIWEMRTEPRHYVHSKVMCWVALDRGGRIARQKGEDSTVKKWSAAAGEIHNAVLEKGFSKRHNSFVQSFGEEELDAATLLIPIHGFLPAEDPRVQGTIDAVWRGLTAGGPLLYRYRCDDGLAGKEGAFLLCSFWLVNALAVSRRIQEARKLFSQLLDLIGPLGLMAEEIDPLTRRLLGNFPQALSHIGLINAALHLGIARGGSYNGPPPQSEDKQQGHEEV